MSNDDPWDEYELTPAQRKLKAYIDKHFKPEYRHRDYGICCTMRINLLYFSFVLNDQNDDVCEKVIQSCKQYLCTQERKQKESALAGT